MRWIVAALFIAQFIFDVLVLDMNLERWKSDKKLCAMIPGAECSYFEFKRRADT